MSYKKNADLKGVRLLRTDQVVEKLQGIGMTDVNVTWVNNRIDRGQLPCTKVGKYRRVREDVLEKMIMRWYRDADR